VAQQTKARADILGCRIDRLTMSETVHECERFILNGHSAQHVSVNAAKLVAMRDNPALREVIESASIVSADGQSIVWASRLLGDDLPERVAGFDLMHRLLALAADRGYRAYFLGARQQVLARAMERLRVLYPGLEIAGCHHGYFADSESDEICAEIRAASPHMLFVAMSSPRKEVWFAEHGATIQVPLTMGVGGSIDVVAGVTRRAPRWAQRAGLEWFFRLIQEPGRLGGRYLTTNGRFVALLAGEMIRRRRAGAG
jgi:N-acetylglucosaminyldiphosphoundecaprenol N-acetyl-beta-D-mannosaminyltransferase